MARTVSEELRARREHRKWVDWHQQSADKRDPSPPAPQYKDCANCPHSGLSMRDRGDWCSPCIWEEASDFPLPPSPSAEFLRLQVLATLPQSVMDDAIRERRASFVEALDVEMIRREMSPRL